MREPEGESMRRNVRVLAARALVATTLASCGGADGRVSGDGGASSDGLPMSGASSSRGDSGHGSGSEPPDAASSAPPTLSPGQYIATADAAPPGCTPTLVGAEGAGGGRGSCAVNLSEMCGAVSYYVTCGCPQGACACVGPTNKVVDFSGCPYCPGDPTTAAPSGSSTVAQVFALCGFPK
jgi:hypothetical protein